MYLRPAVTANKVEINKGRQTRKTVQHSRTIHIPAIAHSPLVQSLSVLPLKIRKQEALLKA